MWCHRAKSYWVMDLVQPPKFNNILECLILNFEQNSFLGGLFITILLRFIGQKISSKNYLGKEISVKMT